MTEASRTIAGYPDAVLIGQGGFGVVYRATDHAHGREVAVKVLHGVLDDTQRRRFDRERKAMGALGGHPNVIAVHDSGYVESGDGYIVMEYAPGGSYGDRIRRNGPLAWPEALEVIVAVASAVEAAHRSGVLHRDIKPDNILIDRFGTPKLTDFGIAALAGSATNTTSTTATLAHAAPEILDGRPSSAASDVYALASTFHNLILGRPPFFRPGDEGNAAMIARILTEAPPDLTTVGVPASVAEVANQSLAKGSQDRPASAGDLSRALAAAAQGHHTADSSALIATTEPLRAPPETAGPKAHVDSGGPTRAVSAAMPPGPSRATASGGPSPGPGSQPTGRTPRSGAGIGLAVVALVAVAALVVLAGMGAVLFARSSPTPSSATAPVTAGATGVPTAPGDLGDVTLGAEVVASDTAPDISDGCGGVISFGPENLVDGNPATAWRLPGGGVGETVVVRFDGSFPISEVGLVPGWAQIEPCDGTSRFEQNRRIETVRWTVGEQTLVQELDPDRPELQTVTLEQPVQSPQVTLEILATTADNGSDYTAISDIRILGR